MAYSLITRALRSIASRNIITNTRPYSAAAAAVQNAQTDSPSSSSSPFTFDKGNDDDIFVKAPMNSIQTNYTVTMPTTFMTGSVIGKRFYEKVTTREADDGNGWTVMLDYRTLKTPTKRALKLPTLALAKAIAAEWEYQEKDGIRPFTMPLMKLACTALERVPVTRPSIIKHLISKFNQDLVFCRAPDDHDLNSGIHDLQVEKIDPLLDWVESEFGFKPVVYTNFFGEKQEDGLVKSVEAFLKKTDHCELASIDALVSASHSLIISLAVFRGRLQIEEAIELIRLEEDFQVDKWGLVEGGHDVDMADIRVQMAAPTVFLGLSRKN